MGRDSDARMKREADEEAAYNDLERSYIYENMCPVSVGLWEWRLIFDRVPLREQISDAMSDAKLMASELGVVTVVDEYHYSYRPLPIDRHEGTPAWTTKYWLKRLPFKKLLVVKGLYPDIAQIARSRNFNLSLVTHQVGDVEPMHKKWIAEYQQLSAADQQDFDKGPFKEPLPEGFWENPTYQVVPADPRDKSKGTVSPVGPGGLFDPRKKQPPT